MFLKNIKWALLWATLIFVLCAIPGRDIPHISILELLAFDKWVHAGLFFIQFLLLTKGLFKQNSYGYLKNKCKFISIFFCVIYGGSLEIMQQLVFEERSADVYDFIANTTGAILGFVFYTYIDKKFLSLIFKK